MRTSPLIGSPAQYLSAAPIEAPPAHYLAGAGKVDRGDDVDDDGPRELEGLALPYEVELQRPHWLTGATRQRFAAGSAEVRPDAKFYYGHDHLERGMPIGRVVKDEQTAEGLRLRTRFAGTPKAREVRQLAKPDEDGVAVLDSYSVGYFEQEWHLEGDGDELVIVHDRIDVFEVSIVPMPAMAGAVIDTVLSTNPNPKENRAMKCTKCGQVHAPGVAECQLDPATLATQEDVRTLSTAIEDLGRQVATLGRDDAGRDDTPAVPGSSYGEFLQMVARRDEAAVEFLAYVGGTTADLGSLLKDSWVGDRYRQIEAQRTALNFFARSPLPASGMGVEYGVEGTDTTAVEKQAAEGDTLAYGKITFDTERAPLETFGGWGEMSFQEIQRAPINVVERYFSSLLRRYAQRTEARVNTEVLAAGEPLAGGVLDLATVDGWTRFVIRAARVLKDRGYPLEGILVGFDVFEDVALLRQPDTGDYWLNRSTGTINITGMSGEAFNVPIIPIETGATTDVVRAANSEAIRTYEAGGAPFRLQDDDITNLTHAASVYGYMATAREVPGAVIRPATV